MNTYNNWGGYYELNFQLHNQVSNPYTFNIKQNYLAHTNIIISLPEKETILYQYKGNYRSFSITIPSGVNIIKYYNDVPGDMWITNRDNNLIWEDFSNWDYYTYVGVSPNKTYNLVYDGYDIGKFIIYYSASINLKEPNGFDL